MGGVGGGVCVCELIHDPAFVLVCCCGLLCTHLRDPVPRFRRHPFSDYGLASVCVCVCVMCVCVFVCVRVCVLFLKYIHWVAVVVHATK